MFTVLLSLFACSNATNNDTADAQVVDPAIAVHQLLQGDFDSTQQASSNTNYFEISLRMCAFELPELGSNILYVEQAATDSLSSPYRQRIYHVESVGERVASHVYSMDGSMENALVGACDSPSDIVVELDQIVERVGCSVWLTPTDDGFSGGTEGIECISTLGEAAYATSIVHLTPSSIESWDQGWDAAGNQVWGATAGAYVFDRLN